MKSILLLASLAAAMVIGLPAPALADTPLADTDNGDLDNFTFESFDATYDLARDADGHSLLTVTETLVAVFPQRDQNRGIRRDLVDRYDGHPTDLEVLSVEDADGNPRPYEAESDGDFVTLTIADDNYVHGRQTYVITYTQRNVTDYFENTNADEFYWDTNGTGWNQPFGEVTATVNLTPELQNSLTGEVDAAYGREGEARPAEITPTPGGYVFRAEDLAPRENLSFAIGFEPGTFVPRDSSFTAAPWPTLALLSAGAALATAFAAIVFRRRKLRDAPGRGIIIAQYEPPKEGVLLSSVILHKTSKATTAKLLELAVAGNLRIVEESAGGGVWSSKPKYRLEYLHDEDLSQYSREFLHAIFGATLTRNEHRSLKSTDTKAVKRLTTLTQTVTKEATERGYRRKPPAGPVSLLVLLAVLTSIATVVFSIISLDQAYGGWLPVLFLLVAVASFITTVVAVARLPLKPKGVELRDHLLGLKEYIRLAEADRLRYLQSPQGALRKNIAVDDPAQVVHLNEQLLPYAVLFGLEKEWAEELGRHYEEQGTEPSWYHGHGAFNAAVFASSVGAVSSSVSSSYSSSSGGSGGGASSGGGGGGGGGGGV